MEYDIYKGLNSVQIEAVNTINGPLLVLAGAGTGKTKVLTSRIANILQQNMARTYEILAVTFTNKAANEMKHQVEKILNYPVDGFWIGTFHSVGLRILKRHNSEAGLQNNFLILDMSDSEKVIKQIMLDKNIDIKKYTPVSVSSMISKLKDKNILPTSMTAKNEFNFGSVSLSSVYETYQERLRELNSVDFGDLLLLCVDLFDRHPNILQLWQDKFKYILVDEYQDTNNVQYIFIRMLALKYNNICCVGDDDQSIYSWRGADISNILRFEEDFANAKVLRLEQNYRSTTAILDVASSLISKNHQRLGKTLWTDTKVGDKVKVFEAFNSKYEAEFLVNTIESLRRKGTQYKDMAILVRASFQTREIEEKLIYNTIPYRFVGGNRFYDRMEIKDAVAYLRLYHMKYDDPSFERIINTPKRGIGDSSLHRIKQYAKDYKISYYNATKEMIGQKLLSTKVEKELINFVNLFEESSLSEISQGQTLGQRAKSFIETTGYIEMWKNEKTANASSRLDNLRELFVALNSFISLENFFEQVALFSDRDEEHAHDKLVVMTMHGAKGLEFDTVFLPGWEEGIFPNQRALDEGNEKALQEERRLAYVGITRAKKDLYISYANNRQIYGNWQSCIPSRFLGEISKDLLYRLSPNLGGHIITKSSYEEDKSYVKNTSSYKGNLYTKNMTDTPHILKAGVKVKHNIMGNGIITNIVGAIATVDFESFGEKKIMVSFLKVIK